MNTKYKKKPHTKYNLDNIKTKIITHFCNYIIILLNEITKKYFDYQRVKFRKINSNIKINIFGRSISNLMKMNLEEFCEQAMSIKYTTLDLIQNSKSFLIFQLIKDNPLINLNLLNIFEKYYLNEEKIEIRNKKGDNVIIHHTNTFKSLKQKQNDSNYINMLIKASKKIQNVDIQNSRNESTNVSNNTIALQEYEFNDNILNRIFGPFDLEEDYNYRFDLN